MKIKDLLLPCAVVLLGSCSTAYRSGQTPDDVYYSPAPHQSEYVTTATEQDKNSYYYRNQEDQQIRRGIEDPVYRNAITFSMGMGGYSPYSLSPYNSFYNPYYNSFGNPFYNDYAYDPYGFKSMYNPYYYDPYGYNSFGFYSPYNYYNSFTLGYGYSPYYSPYYSPILFSTKNVNTNVGPRRYNLNVYNQNQTNSGTNVQPIRSTGTGTVQPTRGTGVGNVIRRVFTPSQRSTYTPPSNNRYNTTRRSYNNNNYYNNNNNNNNNYNTPQRTFSPSSGSSSSSGGGGSNSAPVRTFRR
ncbi:MAG: hypothetical protein ACTHK8_15515 [Ginsengibacter sp.]